MDIGISSQIIQNYLHILLFNFYPNHIISSNYQIIFSESYQLPELTDDWEVNIHIVCLMIRKMSIRSIILTQDKTSDQGTVIILKCATAKSENLLISSNYSLTFLRLICFENPINPFMHTNYFYELHMQLRNMYKLSCQGFY